MSDFLNRLRAGAQAFYAAYSGKSLIPRDTNGYDARDARLSRYATMASYADNEMYTTANPQFLSRKLHNRLYSNIRAIMNVCPRVVDLFVYFVYVGSIDMEHLKTGAIPLDTDDERIKDAARQVFKWSNWNAYKELFVRNGATYGDSAIKVVDDRGREKVYMEPLDPGRIKDVEQDDRGNVKSIVIEYQRDEEPDLTVAQPGQVNATQRKTYVYTEIITKEQFRTYKDNKPFGYYANAAGELVSEWDNEYGFVPVVLAQHNSTGLKWGANAFYKVLRKLDELNDASSLLNDQIRKVLNPLLVALGIMKKQSATDRANGVDLEVNGDGRDSITMLYVPQKDADIKPITPAIDIAAASANNLTMMGEIVNDLPILALQQIRSGGGDLTQPGIEAAYSDAIASVNAARANYDHATVRALQMCMSIGGYMGYEGFEGYTLESYDNGDIDFAIKNRPVINVGMTTERKVELLSSISKMNAALMEVALKELGFDEEVIDEVKAAKEEEAANAARGFGDAVFGSGFSNEDGFEDDEPAQVGAGQRKMLPARV